MSHVSRSTKMSVKLPAERDRGGVFWLVAILPYSISPPVNQRVRVNQRLWEFNFQLRGCRQNSTLSHSDRRYLLYPWNPVAPSLEAKKRPAPPPRDRLRLARAALARFLGVSRARVTQVLKRLKTSFTPMSADAERSAG